MTGALVTPAIATAWLWFFGYPEGRNPGDFTLHLMKAISIADETNREILRTVFPGHVEAYEMGHNETYGIHRLADIVKAVR